MGVRDSITQGIVCSLPSQCVKNKRKLHKPGISHMPATPCLRRVETELQGLAGLYNVSSTFKERPCLKGIGGEVGENIQYPLLASAYAQAYTSAHVCADTHRHS